MERQGDKASPLHHLVSFFIAEAQPQQVTPALVRPNGKAIHTPTSPQPSTKPQKYPTGKDIIK